MDEVLEFIFRFKSKYPSELEDLFTNGYCYWFAIMLTTNFGGEIWYNPSVIHFCAYIDGWFYDITGRFPYNVEWKNWQEYQETLLQLGEREILENIIRTCIQKKPLEENHPFDEMFLL